MKVSAAVATLIVGIGCFGVQPSTSAQRTNATIAEDARHYHWLADRMVEAESVKAGMTRADLLMAFVPDGGMQFEPQTRFVLRRCSLIKVNVTFEFPKNFTQRDLAQMVHSDVADTGQSFPLNSQIKITSVSTPYLEPMFMD